MVCITVSCWSVRGDQVCPPSVVRQMPPVSVATYMTLGSDGSTAMPLSRPVEEGLPGDWPDAMGEGPIGVHVKPLSGMELDGTSRLSNASRLSRVRGGDRRTVPGRRRLNSDLIHPAGAS